MSAITGFKFETNLTLEQFNNQANLKQEGVSNQTGTLTRTETQSIGNVVVNSKVASQTYRNCPPLPNTWKKGDEVCLREVSGKVALIFNNRLNKGRHLYTCYRQQQVALLQSQDTVSEGTIIKIKETLGDFKLKILTYSGQIRSLTKSFDKASPLPESWKVGDKVFVKKFHADNSIISIFNESCVETIYTHTWKVNEIS